MVTLTRDDISECNKILGNDDNRRSSRSVIFYVKFKEDLIMTVTNLSLQI